LALSSIDTSRASDLSLDTMTLLVEATEFKKFDVRMIERNVARGVIKPDDVNRAINALPDDAENAEWVSLNELMSDSVETISNGKAVDHH
jgi:hypothetical protein